MFRALLLAPYAEDCEGFSFRCRTMSIAPEANVVIFI
jgi:hypothetical protein